MRRDPGASNGPDPPRTACPQAYTLTKPPNKPPPPPPAAPPGSAACPPGPEGPAPQSKPVAAPQATAPIMAAVHGEPAKVAVRESIWQRLVPATPAVRGDGRRRGRVYSAAPPLYIQ